MNNSTGKLTESVVQSNIDKLYQQVSNLTAEVALLYEKLGPYMRPMTECNEKSDENTVVSSPISPIVDSLRELGARISSLNTTISIILSNSDI
jgi:hypothetical protein